MRFCSNSQQVKIAPCHSEEPPILVCYFGVFAAVGVKSGRVEVTLSLSGKRGGKSHFGTILLSAVLGIWRSCMVSRSLLPISMETTHDPKGPVLLIALKNNAACLVVSFGDHVPYLRVLAPNSTVPR